LICGILRKLERGGYGKRKKEDEKREIVKKNGTNERQSDGRLEVKGWGRKGERMKQIIFKGTCPSRPTLIVLCTREDYFYTNWYILYL